MVRVITTSRMPSAKFVLIDVALTMTFLMTLTARLIPAGRWVFVLCSSLTASLRNNVLKTGGSGTLCSDATNASSKLPGTSLQRHERAVIQTGATRTENVIVNNWTSWKKEDKT